MAALPPDLANEALASYSAAVRAQRRGAASRARADNSAWDQWQRFCGWLGITADMEGVDDPIPLLQVFAHRVRVGLLAAGRRKIRKRSVEQYLRSVGQIFAGVGAKDPRMDSMGNIDFRLKRQLSTYAREDPAPTRVMPVPLAILLWIYDAYSRGDDVERAIADLCLMAFFFLLRPGEYCAGGKDTLSAPFRLRDVDFFILERRFRAHHRRLADATIDAADFTSLCFNNQKNAVRGERMGHGTALHARANPVRLVGSRVKYLRSHGATADTPLCAVRQGDGWRLIKSTEITKALRAAAHAIGHRHGVSPRDLSTRSMRSGGAMALLLAGVGGERIKILGRWRSDAIMRYLHTTARPLLRGFATRMVEHGDYALLPGEEDYLVPTDD